MTPADLISQLGQSLSPGAVTQAPSELEAYGKDWTKVYPPKPLAIVFPRSTQEVVKVVNFCRNHRLSVVPSGGRTGLAGGAVASQGEVVVSLARMNKMGEVDALAHTLHVEAGAVTEAVHHHCAPHGLTWPVDFASKGSSTVGGNISTNAGGVKVIHYGLTREWVLGLTVVTMAGEVLELNGALEKNNTGLDLRQLFIGTEGTLGIVTEATLKLSRLPGTLDVFFFALADIPAVLKLFMQARKGPFTLMAFETLTHNCLEAVKDHLKVAGPFAEPAGAYVLMEVECPVSPDAQQVLDRWLEGIFESGLVSNGTLAQSPREAKELWSLRESTSESIFHRGFLHKNDIALPVAELEVFIASMHSLFQTKYPEIELYVFGHIGDGNLHINAVKPESMSREAFLKRAHETDEDLFALVQKHKGSVSAEHGIGLLKKEALHYSRTPAEMAYLRAVKKTFDPAGLLNPGKIFD